MVLILVWKYIPIHQHEHIHPKKNTKEYLGLTKSIKLTAIVEQVNRFVSIGFHAIAQTASFDE